MIKYGQNVISNKRLVAFSTLSFFVTFAIAFLTYLPANSLPDILQLYIAVRGALLYALGAATGMALAPYTWLTVTQSTEEKKT
jgi:hypothetical protein